MVKVHCMSLLSKPLEYVFARGNYSHEILEGTVPLELCTLIYLPIISIQKFVAIITSQKKKYIMIF